MINNFYQNLVDFLLSNSINSPEIISYTGADPGFPVGGGADPLGGRQHTILLNFPKNCMKSRKFWAVGGRPPKSATGVLTGRRINNGNSDGKYTVMDSCYTGPSALMEDH